MEYPEYPNYKYSNESWLGKMPEHWKVLSIKRISQVSRGASPRPIDDPKYFDDEGEYSWVRIADVTANHHYLRNTTQKLSELGASRSIPLQKGELFVSIAGSVGKPMITKIDCCIHDGFVYFPSLEIESEFLFYIFDSGQPYLGLGKLGTQLNLNTDTVGGIKIGLPNKYEQQKIAAFLDYKTQQIDQLIEKKKTLIEKLNEQRIAVITQAVTKGLDKNAKMKPSGVDWLGDVPAHWEVKAIKRMCMVKRGASPRPIQDPKYFDDDGEYTWVRISDVTANEHYLKNTTQRLSQLGKSYSVSLEPGSLFLSIAGTVGKPMITEIKCCIHDGFVYFPYLAIGPEFLYYIFLAGQCYLGLGKLGTQLNLNTDTVGAIKIGAPPKEEQEEIIQFLHAEMHRLDIMAEKVNSAITVLEEYRSTLITNAVTGKIDVRTTELPAV